MFGSLSQIDTLAVANKMAVALYAMFC
jgi:hypothetical protein